MPPSAMACHARCCTPAISLASHQGTQLGPGRLPRAEAPASMPLLAGADDVVVVDDPVALRGREVRWCQLRDRPLVVSTRLDGQPRKEPRVAAAREDLVHGGGIGI